MYLKSSRSIASTAELALVALGAGELAGQLLLEAAPVEQPGQGVVVGEVLELALEALALGDVLDLGEHVERLAVAVAHDASR